MPTLLDDLSPEALVAAIDHETADLYLAQRDWPGATVHDAPDLGWALSHLRYAVWNGVYRTRLEPDQADVAIESVVAEARARGVPLLWWVTPLTQPKDLVSRLQAHGFALADRRAGMALDLRDRTDGRPTPAGLEIRPVSDTDALRLWVQVHARSAGLPPDAEQAHYELLASGEAPYIAWLGWLDGAPAATSMMLRSETVAGINFVATVPEARRRGIGSAMTLAAVRGARECGYGYAVLKATEMGAGVYRALGFRECCQIAMYVWRPG